MSPAPRLADLARKLGRLTPDWRNPERYFENRSEIEREMRRLAKHLEDH
ncbi:hypothetical protein [uncultured Sphingomonas sp.]|nr:hypothetical protein [uncultured Sphingomonas sp.]